MKYKFLIIAGLILASCGESKSDDSENSEKKEENKKEIPKMTPEQEKYKNFLVETLTKLGQTSMTIEETTEISKALANKFVYDPELLMPMVMFYTSYEKEKGNGIEKNWNEITFYDHVSGVGTKKILKADYSFGAVSDEGSVIRWSLFAETKDGKFDSSKLGGLIKLSAKDFGCIENGYLKFYLENGEEVSCFGMKKDFTCELNQIGASLEISTLKMLAKDQLKSVKIIDGRTGKSVIIPITNKYMKTYFQNTLKAVEKL